MPGLSIDRKSPEMTQEMEEFITDTIIIAKVRNGGNTDKMAEAIQNKLNGRYGKSWAIFILKNASFVDFSFRISHQTGTFIEVTHGRHTYTVYKQC